MNIIHTTTIEELFSLVDAHAATNAGKAPFVGISVHSVEDISSLRLAYSDAVIQAGGIPVLLPLTTELEVLVQQVAKLDALVMSGGGDIDPQLLGEEAHPNIGTCNPARDRYDLALVRLARLRQLPILAICKGHQVLNLAEGGTLYQDIVTQCDVPASRHSQAAPRHEATHEVALTEGSFLRHLFDAERVAVNSIHHQAVRAVAPSLVAVGLSCEDQINEAIELPMPRRRVIGVQWHPEALAINGNNYMQKLFSNLVEEAALYRRVQYVHDDIISLDSHCDTPSEMTPDYHFSQRNTQGLLVDLPRMTQGRLDAVFMAAYLKQGDLDSASLEAAKRSAVAMLDGFERQVEQTDGAAVMAYSSREIIAAKAKGVKAVVPCIENGYAIGDDLENLRYFRRRGVVYMTLCHNGDNLICDSVRGTQPFGGLSAFGEEVVREMFRLGVIVDLSHAADSTFWAVDKIAPVPYVATHSSCRTLCDHPRNLTDDQIRAVAAKNGVVQICLYEYFLRKGGDATLSDIIRHIEYVVDLVGIDYVGIGSDFDGGGGVPGCRDSSELINITFELLRRGFSPEQLRKLWGGNFLRVMESVEAYALAHQ